MGIREFYSLLAKLVTASRHQCHQNAHAGHTGRNRMMLEAIIMNFKKSRQFYALARRGEGLCRKERIVVMNQKGLAEARTRCHR